MEFRYKVQFGAHGFPYVDPDTGVYLRVDHGSEQDGIMQVSITGNREGLLFLAKNLISLAEFQGPPDYHFHLDPYTQARAEMGFPRVFLEEDSDELILYKRERPSK